MNATLKARAIYNDVTSAVRTPRSVEYQAFARVTSRLKQAIGNDVSIAQIAASVHENRELWITLAGAVAATENELPDKLKAGLLSLAEFTNRYSSKVLNESASLVPLVEINAMVMGGLRTGSAGR